MEEKHRNHSGFGNGFLLGILIGIIATLLLTTKRGREILREFTKKGLDKISDIEKKIEKTASNAVRTASEAISELEEIDDEYIPSEPAKEISQTKPEIRSEKQNNGNGSHKPPKRHFFRSKKD